jgi:hypothetical protein
MANFMGLWANSSATIQDCLNQFPFPCFIKMSYFYRIEMLNPWRCALKQRF